MGAEARGEAGPVELPVSSFLHVPDGSLVPRVQGALETGVSLGSTDSGWHDPVVREGLLCTGGQGGSGMVESPVPLFDF